MRRRIPDGLSLASMAVLGGAVLLVVATVWSAVRIEPLPTAEAPRADAELVLAGAARDGRWDSTSVAVVLASDPFNPGRRLPDELVEHGPARDTVPPAPTDTVRLLGTVVRGNASFAVCQLTNDLPRIVHLGERLGVLTLISLEPGRAVFRAPNGTRLELSLSKPGT
jgi:hypothetical protein